MDQLQAPLRLEPQERMATCMFLLAFSRFEFALKRSGFAHTTQRGEGDERIVVDWWAFAQRWQPTFRLTAQLEAALQPLLLRPPAREVLQEDGPRFENGERPTANEFTLPWLLKMTYRIRNNLFHGGKWPLEPARDVPLLKAGLAVLRECLDLDARLRANYGVAQ